MTSLAGLATLVRFILRRDRLRAPVWIVATSGIAIAQASGLPDLYPTAADRQDRADLVDNPAFALFLGGSHGLDDYTIGAILANEGAPILMLVVAIMSVVMVTRHTRAEEETGRAELVRAGVVGRHATALATLIVVGGMNVVIGVLLAVGIPASVDGLSSTGALALGASVSAVGLVFTAIALVTAQVTEFGRAASGMALAVLGAMLALKTAGAIADLDVFTWMSPLGWSQETRAFVDERWWPLALSVVATVVLISVAFQLSARRDVGGGLMAPGLGRPAASTLLGTPTGLAVRLQRTSVIGWAVPLFLFGLLFGGVAEEMADFAEDNEFVRDYLAHIGASEFVDGAIAVYLSFFAVVSVAFAIQSVTMLRREESATRAETVLATSVSRVHWTMSHLLVALVGSVVLLVAGGLGYGVARAISAEDIGELPKLIGAMLAYAPAMWLLAGAAVALFGLVPRLSGAPWAAFGFVVFVAWFGPLLDFPSWFYNLSPFEHIPAVPAQDLTFAPLAIITAISAALIAVGLIGIRRRDIVSN